MVVLSLLSKNLHDFYPSKNAAPQSDPLPPNGTSGRFPLPESERKRGEFLLFFVQPFKSSQYQTALARGLARPGDAGCRNRQASDCRG